MGDMQMISRRHFSIGLTSAIVTSNSAIAAEMCPAPGFQPNSCSALVEDFVSQQGQLKSQWCWAACVSMICNHHGFPLSQESVVDTMYGGLINMPGDDKVLVKVLSAKWTADNGANFKISAKVFSPTLGSAGVSNQQVVDDLKNNYPLLNGSGTHATVTVRADYFPNPGGQPDIKQVHVIDPYPGAAPPPQMARFLSRQEMTAEAKGGSLRFLASIRVTAA